MTHDGSGGTSEPPALLPALAELPGHLLWRAQLRVTACLAEVLPENVDIHGYAALLALDGEVTRSQQALADAAGVSRTTMARVAANLASRGLVERVRNPADRRSYALSRTPAGGTAAAEWRHHVEELEAALTAGFSRAERDDLRALLHRVIAESLDAAVPPSLTDSVGFLVTRVQARTRRELVARLAPLGLEPRHFATMATIASLGEITQTELARAMGVSGASVVAMADEMEERGLLTRRRDDRDRRLQVLRLRPSAARMLPEGHEAATTTIDHVLGALGPAELERLVPLLQRFVLAPPP